VHLAFNHAPVMFLPIAIAMLIVAMRRHSVDLKNASLMVLVVTAIITPAVYLTGEPAEHVIENLPAVSLSAIEEHEESAMASTVVAIVAGVVAAAVLGAGRGWWDAPAWMLQTALVVAILAAGLMARTAWLGGHVSHPEIRGGLTSAGEP
jgi:hypothetical protein